MQFRRQLPASESLAGLWLQSFIKLAKVSESQILSVQHGKDSSPLVTGGVNERICSE